jgi:polysaccharide chain length determinant protein (PEP-CTERM system associated)
MYKALAKVLGDILGSLRFRWQGLIFAWIVCVAGWVGTYMLPNNYESKAVLYIDTATVLRPLLADLAVSTNVMSEVRMMTEVLLSRPQLERVARDTDLDLRADSPEEMDELIARLRERVSVTGGAPQAPYSEASMYTIGFTDREPEMVYSVVNSLVNFFVERSLDENKADSKSAQKFIEEQIHQYEERLAGAEQRLADFKKENVGLMPSSGQDYYERLQVALEERDDIRERYEKIERRRDELQKQIEGEEPTFGLLVAPDDPSKSESTGRADPVQVYEDQLAELLLKYTEKHPKVIALQTRIDQMRAQSKPDAVDDEQPTFELNTDLVSMNSLDLNPVYQSLKIAISQANADLSEVRQEVEAAEERVSYLQRMVNTIPEIEAQLSRLNRDYEVNKAQHTALLKRLESARLSDEAEFRTEEVKFRIIEPPIVPLKPVSPNRPLFATVVLFGGVLSGAAFAFLLNLINPVFNSVEELRQALSLPILGSVSMFETEVQNAETRQANRRFNFAAAGLFVAYLGSIVFWVTADSFKAAFSASGVSL